MTARVKEHIYHTFQLITLHIKQKINQLCSKLNVKHSEWNFQQRTNWNNFFLFSQENQIWHFMQIVETICMKCQILFFGKIKKNIIYLSSAESAQTVVKVKSIINLLKIQYICIQYMWNYFNTQQAR